MTPDPLDERSVHLAAVGMALVLRHPDLGNFVARARQRGVSGDEIAHLAAIAGAIAASMSGVPGPPPADRLQSPIQNVSPDRATTPIVEPRQQRPGACC